MSILFYEQLFSGGFLILSADAVYYKINIFLVGQCEHQIFHFLPTTKKTVADFLYL